MITIKELAQELNVSEQALRSWCKRNEIKKTSYTLTTFFLTGGQQGITNRAK